MRVQAAVDAQFERKWVVEPSLEHLWPRLAFDEELRVLAEVSRGVRAGVLAVTDRRVLLVTTVLGEQVATWPRSAIRRASGRDVALFAWLKLELAGGEEVKLAIGPRGRLREVLAELDGG